MLQGERGVGRASTKQSSAEFRGGGSDGARVLGLSRAGAPFRCPPARELRTMTVPFATPDVKPRRAP
jgi:hypothetical protein